jgi:hypothetical protein
LALDVVVHSAVTQASAASDTSDSVDADLLTALIEDHPGHAQSGEIVHVPIFPRNKALDRLGPLLRSRFTLFSAARPSASAPRQGIAPADTRWRRSSAMSAIETRSGTAKVVCPTAGRRASYDWEYSTDGGKTWIPLPSSLQAKTTITGLAQGSTVEVRYRAITKTGVADWSQPTSLFMK